MSPAGWATSAEISGVAGTAIAGASLKGRSDLAYGFSADQWRRAQAEHGNVSTIAKREGWSQREHHIESLLIEFAL